MKSAETNLLRISRLYAMASAINEAILRSSDALALYQAACRIAVEGGMQLAWVGFVEESQVEVVARWGVRSDYTQEIKLSLLEGPLGNGPVGRAYRNGSHWVCNDVAEDRDFAPWREAALARGFHSSAAFALKSEGRAIGLFCVYSEQTDYFEPEVVRLLTALADNLSFSIGLQAGERQRAALARQVEQERARLLEAQRVAKVGSWETDVASLRVFWSPQTHRIFETDPVRFQPTHSSFLEMVHPEDREQVGRAFESSLSHERPCVIEHRIITGTGQVRIVEERWQAFFNEQGVAERALGTCLDISERRQAEAEAARASEDFRVLAESMPQIVWTTDPSGACTYLNRRWLGYTGMSLEDSLRDGWIDCFHPEDLSESRRVWDEAMRTRGNYTFEFRLRRADGEYRWWLNRGEPLLDEQGEVLKWLGTSTDIHELTVANRALQMLRRCDEALVRAESEPQLLQSVCDIAVQLGGYSMAWVGYALDDAAKSIEPQAHAGHEAGYLADIRLSWDENKPEGQGPAGQVLRSGRVMEVTDLLNDPHFAPWVEAARARGYQGLVNLPLRDEQRTFGFLGLFRSRRTRLSADELKLLQELADDLAYGIVALRVRTERQRPQDAVLAIARGVSANVGADFFAELTAHLVEAVHADAGFISVLNPDKTTARTLAILERGQPRANFDYEVDGSHCQNLLHQPIYVLRQGAARQPFFLEAYAGSSLQNAAGECVGMVGVLFAKPTRSSDFLVSTLQIFAARAASEMERLHSDARVREQASWLDKAQDAISVWDLELRVSYWNKGAERLYGWSDAQAQGRPLRELLGFDTQAFSQARGELLSKGEWQGELAVATHRGEQLTVICRWTLVRDGQGNPHSVLAIDTDITERKRLEEQFLRAQRLESIGRLAGGIAHDLNNALGPILMSTELLRLQVADSDGQELVDSIASCAERGAEMVRQLLSFARGVDGEREAVPLAKLLQDVAKIANDTFLKSIEVSATSDPELWPVLGDATQIHQVLMNLCVNARDAMPDGGRLDLSASNHPIEGEAFLRIRVRDSGSGISAEDLDKIFDPFFTTKEVGSGTGLGLSTSMAIVKSHGGFLQVRSQPGQGTTFEVFLPAQPQLEVGSAPRKEANLPEGNGELILVVDDEESVRKVTRRSLERFGYRVLTAASGCEALALYREHRQEVSVVLTDMMMPGLNGPALVAALRELDPAVRVVGVSGLSSQAPPLDLKYLLPKPYKTEVLLRALRDLLENQ